MKTYLFDSILLFIIVLCSCNSSQNTEKWKKELIDTDMEFSGYSVQYGMNKSFIEYFDSTGVLLRDNSNPIVGINKIREFLQGRDDSGFDLSWKPLYADVAKSGDLGYTYGIWELSLNDSIYTGSYLTVWKKNNDGKWRMVLDTGNDGLSAKNSLPE